MQPREISNDEYVSQRVHIDDDGQLIILNAPRLKDNDRLSGTLGQRSAADMQKRVRRHPIPPCEKDGVRYARVGTLRDAGFTLEHAPNSRNPEHATLRWASVWDERVAGIFNGCFSAPLWHAEEQER